MATYFLYGSAVAFVITIIYFWGYIGDRFKDKELAWKLWFSLSTLSVFVWPFFAFIGSAWVLALFINKLTPKGSKKKAK